MCSWHANGLFGRVYPPANKLGSQFENSNKNMKLEQVDYVTFEGVVTALYFVVELQHD
jgi:hypothetical protein